jgi:hypothetical protein
MLFTFAERIFFIFWSVLIIGLIVLLFIVHCHIKKVDNNLIHIEDPYTHSVSDQIVYLKSHDS